MQVRELIEELQRFDPDFQVKVESLVPHYVQCRECGSDHKFPPMEGLPDKVKVSGHRCEVVIELV